MKKYEYKMIDLNKLVEDRRKVTGDNLRDAMSISHEVLNELGLEGWLVKEMHNQMIGVREVDGRRTNGRKRCDT